MLWFEVLIYQVLKDCHKAINWSPTKCMWQEAKTTTRNTSTGYQTTCAAFQISTVLGARTKTSLTEIECCYSSELSRISLNLVATAEQHFHTKLMQGSISQRLVHILSTRHCCRWLVLKTWSTLTDRVLKVRIRGKLNKVIGHQVLQ